MSFNERACLVEQLKIRDHRDAAEHKVVRWHECLWRYHTWNIPHTVCLCPAMPAPASDIQETPVYVRSMRVLMPVAVVWVQNWFEFCATP
jgi:hypothetical protein